MPPVSRAEFIASHWLKYPAAERQWLDVSSYAQTAVPRKQAQIVAGRLRIQSQIFSIVSNGVSLDIQFNEHLTWLRPIHKDLPVSLDYFADGDLIAVEVSCSPETNPQRAKVLRILLLAPSQGHDASAPVTSPVTASEFFVLRSQQWQSYVAFIRQHFTSLGFIEVLTPTLVPSPGTEPFLDPFQTDWTMGSATRKFYLPTSPEFHLKQLLVRGWTKIFELKTCFRNGEVGVHHQPEFLMLEWYRAFAPLDSIADDVESLLNSLAAGLSIVIPKLRRTTMTQLFADAFAGFQLTPRTSVPDLQRLASRVNIAFSTEDSFDDLFFRLFLERIEGELGVDGPLLVSDYPPSQAALSRIGTNGFAERFEVYWRGLEIANAFHELNDPAQNEVRFAEDAAKKSELGKPAVPRDENLVQALKTGMPPSGGIALGVDRLFMALYDLKSIGETRAFPFIRLY